MFKIITFIALPVALYGCQVKEPADPTTGIFDDSSGDAPGPGDAAWADEDVTCEATSDCLVGESCLQNVCQPAQCEGGLIGSAAPLGTTYAFFADNEIGVADKAASDGSYWVDTYEPNSSRTSYDGSTDISSSRLVDITGGRFEKTNTPRYAAVIEGRNAIGFTSGSDTDWVSVSFSPIAIDAGDTDVDGLDEVVSVSSHGEIANCSMDTAECTLYSFDDDDVTMLDVATGDIDGDAVAEIALLLELDGNRYIYVLNHDHEGKDQPESYQKYVEDAIRLDVGDLDGDRVAEIVVLRDVDDWPVMNEEDAMDVYNTTTSATDDEVGELNLLASYTTPDLTELEDVEIADTDADSFSEIYIVDIGGTLGAYDMEAGTIYERFTETLSRTMEPHRLALTDIDGDSPQATLMNGPELAKGAPIPGALVLMPPYDIDHSAGPAGSFYGSGESTSEEYSDTISLGMKVDLGVSLDILPGFAAAFGESMSWRVRQTHGERTRQFVGGRFGMSADPEMYGPYHGAVVLHWGCFDTYTYEVNDPSGHASELDGENFVLTVPVGGSVSVWSVARYNAMAEALGTLPIIEVPYAVGDVDDYPSEPERLDGSSIPDDDMVFSDETWYTAPDVGTVSFWRSLSEEESTRMSWDTTMGTSASVTAAGIKVGVGSEYGWGEGYSLSLGRSALFAGSVKAVPDDPSTPEDEYNLYTYRFSPLVYREWYSNANGDDAAFYVMSYVAER